MIRIFINACQALSEASRNLRFALYASTRHDPNANDKRLRKSLLSNDLQLRLVPGTERERNSLVGKDLRSRLSFAMGSGLTVAFRAIKESEYSVPKN